MFSVQFAVCILQCALSCLQCSLGFPGIHIHCTALFCGINRTTEFSPLKDLAAPVSSFQFRTNKDDLSCLASSVHPHPSAGQALGTSRVQSRCIPAATTPLRHGTELCGTAGYNHFGPFGHFGHFSTSLKCVTQ